MSQKLDAPLPFDVNEIYEPSQALPRSLSFAASIDGQQ
jgi:hypothetical protein